MPSNDLLLLLKLSTFPLTNAEKPQDLSRLRHPWKALILATSLLMNELGKQEAVLEY